LNTSNPILVVGSVAIDSVKTPHGEATEAIGGAATFFGVAATVLHRPVHLVGVIGDDFPNEVVSMLEGRGVDCSGLGRVPGKTFRWKGYYEGDMNAAVTVETLLNVFGDFRPVLPPSFRAPDYLFLANIDPEIQLDVLGQIKRPQIVAADTMNFWIASKRQELLRLIAEVDLMVMNDTEAMQLTSTSNLVTAAREILRLGPKVVAIKKGSNGALLCSATDFALIPAFPLETVVDPTGAGDSFGAGLMAAMARRGADADDFAALRESAAYGSVIASFNCESFSMERLKTLTVEEVEERLSLLRGFAAF
jgi:sugar/nucleoside kinase (ribokinase family)